MRPGIFAKTFSRPTMEEVFDAVAGHGIRDAQLNMSVAGLPSMPEGIDPALAERVRLAAAERGVAICAVSGTFNMAHPEAAVREHGLRRLDVISGACKHLGTSTITLCTGTRDPGDMWRKHPDNVTREAWRDMLSTVQRALEISEDHGVTLAFEPETNNVVDAAQKARRLLDEAASPRLKVVVDAANLFDAGKPGRRLSDAKRILSEAFDLLGGDIVLAHAKDVRASGEIVAAGTGALDYDLYLEHLRATDYDGPLILHGLEEHEVERSLTFLKQKLANVRRPPDKT